MKIWDNIIFFFPSLIHLAKATYFSKPQSLTCCNLVPHIMSYLFFPKKMEYTRYITKARDCVFLSSQEMSVLNRIIERSSPTRTNNINTWTAEQTNLDPKLSNEHTHQMFLGCQQFGLLVCSCWSCLQGIFLEAHIL